MKQKKKKRQKRIKTCRREDNTVHEKGGIREDDSRDSGSGRLGCKSSYKTYCTRMYANGV